MYYAIMSTYDNICIFALDIEPLCRYRNIQRPFLPKLTLTRIITVLNEILGKKTLYYFVLHNSEKILTAKIRSQDKPSASSLIHMLESVLNNDNINNNGNNIKHTQIKNILHTIENKIFKKYGHTPTIILNFNTKNYSDNNEDCSGIVELLSNRNNFKIINILPNVELNDFTSHEEYITLWLEFKRQGKEDSFHNLKPISYNTFAIAEALMNRVIDFFFKPMDMNKRYHSKTILKQVAYSKNDEGEIEEYDISGGVSYPCETILPTDTFINTIINEKIEQGVDVVRLYIEEKLFKTDELCTIVSHSWIGSFICTFLEILN